MNKIIIKEAISNDWKVLQKLNNDVYQSDSVFDLDLDLNRPFSEGGVAYIKKLASGDYGKCYIAFVEGKPAGYIAMSKLKFDHRKSMYVEVENMGVAPEYRSQGIGKLLIDKAKKWAIKSGINKLFVVAYFKNERAIKFYKKEGFEEIGLELEMKI